MSARSPSRMIVVLLVGTALMHLPVFGAYLEAARRLALPYPTWIAGLLAFAAGALFLGRARATMADYPRPPWRVRLFDVPYFIHWCAAAWSFLPSLVAAVVWPLVSLARGRGLELPWTFFLGVYISGLVAAAWGILVRRRWVIVKYIDIPIAGLPESFHGFTIAHLSDLHIGSLTPRAWGERWVRMANALKPDITVVTGDLVTSGTHFHQDIADIIAGLRAESGVFVSMGNHDYFGEGEPLISLIRESGVTVLRNQGHVLERQGDRVYLAGIDDTWTRRADLDAALEARPDGLSTVLLAHDPAVFPLARERGVELTLSGHTHGGQLAVPFFERTFSLSHLVHRYHLGLYQEGDASLYVHPGLGTTGPPMRLGVAPAVVLIRLVNG